MRIVFVLAALLSLSGCGSVNFSGVLIDTSPYVYTTNHVSYSLGYYTHDYYRGYRVYGTYGHRYYYAPRYYTYHRYYTRPPTIIYRTRNYHHGIDQRRNYRNDIRRNDNRRNRSKRERNRR